jgi:surfeit locus 1 family protein
VTTTIQEARGFPAARFVFDATGKDGRMRRLVFLLLFGLGGAAVLLSLGVWQIQRLSWKQGILTQIEARIAAPVMNIPQDAIPDRDKYLPVEVQGRFIGPDLRVLVSLKQVGAGYRLISAFETTTGRRIMVDRGFVRTEAAQSDPPRGLFVLRGNLHWPQETDGYTPAPDPDGGLWFARDVPAMAQALTTEPILLVLRSATPEIPSVLPIPVDTARIPNDHLQYAITWFSLALIWLAMTAFFLGRKRPKQQS